MIKLENLTVKLENKIIFEHFSLNIPLKKYTSITGKNGSGKTTLAKILASLIPFEGNIKISSNNKTEELMQKDIGMVFQNPDDQFVKKIVIDDLAFGLENLNISKQEMEKAIFKIAKEFDIEYLLYRKINELSGGEKQKIALCGVLLLKPQILILDESFIMLEKKVQKNIQELIKNYQKTYLITIIHITHDSDIILDSDNLIVLNKGAVKYTGLPKDFYLDSDNEKYTEHQPLNIKIYKKLNNKIPYFQTYKDLNV